MLLFIEIISNDWGSGSILVSLYSQCDVGRLLVCSAVTTGHILYRKGARFFCVFSDDVTASFFSLCIYSSTALMNVFGFWQVYKSFVEMNV